MAIISKNRCHLSVDEKIAKGQLIIRFRLGRIEVE